MSNTPGGSFKGVRRPERHPVHRGTNLGRSPAILSIDVPLTDRRVGATDDVAGDIARAVEDWFDLGLEDEAHPARLERGQRGRPG